MTQHVNANIETYNIDHWSAGYFSINSQGHITLVTSQNGQKISGDFVTLTHSIQKVGLRYPVLVRFLNIIEDRVKALHHNFHSAMVQLDYNARFTTVYPIKVNQQKRVVETLVNCANPQANIHVGLEAGSKPELLAALAASSRQHGCIICNGYKDREYIQSALMGLKMGIEIIIVIEKLSEFFIIEETARVLGVTPRLGVRVRLSNTGSGNWQNTGGNKSKFGLSASQLVDFIGQLKERNLLSCLELLHVHMGSQISDIDDIRKCVSEAMRYYIEISKMGARLSIFDVGGGLGVDYEGTRSTSYFSMNYSTAEYAWTIIKTIKDACALHQISYPDIITESGRALTAHHAVLITNVVEMEKVVEAKTASLKPPAENAPVLVWDLWNALQASEQTLSERKAVEIYHQLHYLYRESKSLFFNSALSLEERALTEKYYFNACSQLLNSLKRNNKTHSVLIDNLNDVLATKLFTNFSVFQSTPDVWGIEQVFPILPITQLDKPSGQRVKLHDLTCDSDGRIDHYTDGLGIETSLPYPDINPNEQNLLGIFLVGAYQEILGDIHNLFGDTDSVDVVLTDNDTFKLSNIRHGDDAESVLKHVNFNADDLINAIELKIHASDLSEKEKYGFLNQFKMGLKGYTYLLSL